MSEIDIERLKVDADYWDRQWDRLNRWQKLKAVTVLGVPRPNENYIMKITYKEGKALDYILLYTDCKTISHAIAYLKGMYNDGMTINEILSYFETTAPTNI